jgi:pteridine reductase
VAKEERRKALVTGGAVRVGRSISAALAGADYDVAVHYHSSALAAKETVQALRSAGARAEAFQYDLMKAAGIGGFVDEAVAWLGGLDLLVCSAAAFRPEDQAGLTPPQWDGLFGVNARAPYFCARAAAVHMGDGASIINILDVAAFEVWPAYATYAASKAALASLTRSLAVALAPGIRVNGIAPGPILAPDGADEAERSGLRDLTLPGLDGTPDDLTQAVLYVDGAAYVTGQILRVDGGQSLK